MSLTRLQLSLAALVLFATSSFAQERTLTVLASGSATAVADRASLSLTVSSADQTATALFVRQNDVLKRLKQALVSAGVEARDIVEQPFRLMPNYEYGQNGTRIIGYRVDTPLEVEVDKVDDLPRLIDLAATSGASQIAIGSFSKSGTSSLHADAVKSAIANARKEATALAKEMGKSIGDIVSVSEAEEMGRAAAPAGREEEEERRERGGAQQKPNMMSEHAELKVVFELK